jgi:hypothetical protein
LNFWKRILYVAVGLAAVAFAYNIHNLILGRRYKRDFESTFRTYAHAIESRDYIAAYSFGDPAFKAALSPEVFISKQMAFEANLGGLKSVNTGEVYIHGKGSPMQWTAMVAEVRQYDKGQVQFVCEFHLEDGRWQMFGCKQRG